MTTIDLSCVSDKTKKYTAHYIPCKIRYDGESTEFENNFIFDEDEMKERNKNDDHATMYVNYLRGRKILGKKVVIENSRAFLMDGKIDTTAADGGSVDVVAEVSSMINYERDGNESRLQDEMARFQEYLQLSDIVHS